jgi:hypothetical protein
MPATILFFSANPSDTSPLELDEECRAIVDEKDRARLRDAFDVRPVLAARIDDLRRKLAEHAPAVVHFGGHGERASGEGRRGSLGPTGSPRVGRGELLLEDEAGSAAPVPMEALAELFRIERGVRCVVLNACHTAAQAEAIGGRRLKLDVEGRVREERFRSARGGDATDESGAWGYEHSRDASGKPRRTPLQRGSK